MYSATILSALLAGVANAHFFGTAPPMPFNESTSTQMPCGGFDVKNHTVMTNWAVSGGMLKLTSVDDALDATINFAMYSNTSMMVPAYRFAMKGKGDLCLPSVPVPPAFAKMSGMEAVMQIVGKTDDGTLAQCSFLFLMPAVTTAAAVPADCKNSTGVTATLEALPTHA